MRVYPKFSHTSRSHIFQLLSIRSNFKIFRLSDGYILYKSIQGHPLLICLCQLEFLSKLCFLTWTIPCRELIFPIAFRGGVYPDNHREWTWVWLKKKKNSEESYVLLEETRKEGVLFFLYNNFTNLPSMVIRKQILSECHQILPATS